MSKRPAPNGNPTRQAKKMNRATMLHQVMEIVLPNLHWSDAISVGATCKDFRKLYEKHSDNLLAPLLKQLDSMAKSNVHDYCGQRIAPPSKMECTCENDRFGDQTEFWDLDPRFWEGYDDWNTHKKCAAMVEYISVLVGNMREYLAQSFLDPSSVWEETNSSHWEMGGGLEAETEWLHMHPRRGALALNLAILSFAQGGMGNDFYFNEAFLGYENIYLGGGSCERRTT